MKKASWLQRLLGNEIEKKSEHGRANLRNVNAAENSSEAIVLDDRERASGLDDAIERVLGRPPRVERLAVGDVLVAGKFLIERKETNDFAASIMDGRLFSQLRELVEQPFLPVMILEGEFKRDEIGVSPAALRGAMLSVSLDWRVPILRSRSVDETALWISSMLDRLDSKGSSKFDPPPDWRGITPDGKRLPESTHDRPKKRTLAPETQKRCSDLEVLSRLPGLGEKKAELLLEKFGSLAGVIQASLDDLGGVKGVGKKMAEKVYRELHGNSERDGK